MSATAVNYDDLGGVAICTLVVALALHSCFNLMIRSRSIRNWRPVDGHFEYFNDYPIYVYGSKGAVYRTDKGTGIEARYSYSYGAATFTASYVSVVDFPPRLWAPDYKDLAPGLKDAYSNKKPIHVLVNPDKPHEAVLATLPVAPQIKRALLALFVGGSVLGFIFMGMISDASWAYGGFLGFILYLPFAAGFFSTAF